MHTPRVCLIMRLKYRVGGRRCVSFYRRSRFRYASRNGYVVVSLPRRLGKPSDVGYMGKVTTRPSLVGLSIAGKGSSTVTVLREARRHIWPCICVGWLDGAVNQAPPVMSEVFRNVEQIRLWSATPKH